MNALVDDTDNEEDSESDSEFENEEEDQLYKSLISRAIQACTII